MVRNFKYEPEFLTPVGTTSLQPLTFSEMPFVTDPYILKNILEINFSMRSRVDPPSESECTEEKFEDEIIDDIIDESQSMVLYFHRERDGSGNDRWTVMRSDEVDEDMMMKRFRGMFMIRYRLYIYRLVCE